MSKLPKTVTKYFWGDNLKDLNWKYHKDYITKTILEKGDSRAIRWLMVKMGKNYIKKVAKEKRLESKSKKFWRFYLS
ncbi:hypothetical protein A3E14_02390 [Candidatus Curtissbacteria bacterium RIFCSPHIGHO2_12_FULL_41_13]|nr:MAG: hypothetical protein A3E14_02390 [Candidatus Curtissbacteria bacterium RIFCSPHIGHO2_12_FULL_41_13]